MTSRINLSPSTEQPVITKHAACFVITGEFITNQARTFWADEERPDRAIDLLMTGVSGMRIDQALDVLTGRRQLVGDSCEGIELTDDDAKLSPGENVLPSLGEMFSRLHRRAEMAERDLLDYIEIESRNGVSLASPTGLRTVSKMTHDKLKAGSIEWSDVRVYKQASTTWLDVTTKFETRRTSTSPPYEPIPPEPITSFPSIVSDTGWLAPTGRFYPCQRNEHIRTADCICRNLSIDFDGIGEHKLELLGWVKLAGKDGAFEGDREPTGNQCGRLVDWCLGHGHGITPMPHWCKPGGKAKP